MAPYGRGKTWAPGCRNVASEPGKHSLVPVDVKVPLGGPQGKSGSTGLNLSWCFLHRAHGRHGKSRHQTRGFSLAPDGCGRRPQSPLSLVLPMVHPAHVSRLTSIKLPPRLPGSDTSRGFFAPCVKYKSLTLKVFSVLSPSYVPIFCILQLPSPGTLRQLGFCLSVDMPHAVPPLASVHSPHLLERLDGDLTGDR